MSLLNTAVNLLMAPPPGAAGYSISRSLRFNSSDSAYLSRTPASAGNRKTWTWAAWVKRSALQSGTSNTYMQLFTAGTGPTNRDVLFFDTDTDDTLAFYSANGIAGGATLMFRTNAVFRDASAWMHVMLAVDTTQATAANRVKLYVNGTEQTFSTVSYPSQNAEGYINLNNTHYIATHPPLGEYFSGYLADVIFIDGQQLTPSSLVETSATTGQLVPKAYTGSFGTNGFWLPFSDNSAATATTLGKDYSGNGNNWTPNNLQTTTGGPTSVAAASGALPIYNTTDTYGATKGTGTRTDSNSSSIVLALPMDGANNGTTFTDESATIKGSGSAKTVTANGNAKTVTSQSKYYGSSGAFDGGDDYLLASASADFQFGSGNFTIETWFYPNTAARMALYHGSFGTDWSIGIDFSNITQTIAIWASSTGTNWNLADGDSAGNRGSTVLVTGRWHHVAMVRNGATLQLYVNGILDKQFTGISGSIVDRSSSQPSIGTWFGGQYDLNGYLQDFRIYKGVAKYTGNFNPPSSTQNATVAAGNDSLVDTPTSYGTGNSGGDVRGNYCTWNPLTKGSNVTLANGNLDAVTAGTGSSALGTIGISSGKWYFEGTQTGGCIIGVANSSVNTSTNPGVGLANSWTWYSSNTGVLYFVTNGSFSGWTLSKSLSDVLQIAVDATDITSIKVYAGVNNVWYNSSGGTTNAPDAGGSAIATITTGVTVFPIGGAPNYTNTLSANFGQRPFAYTAPSGFKALCDTNLPAPVVAKSSDYFQTVLYTGNGSTQTVSGLSFSPDLVWLKGRSVGYSHQLYDQVRGAGKLLGSNTTNAESTVTDNLTAFTSSGFTLGNDAGTNQSSATYVAWAFDAGSSTVTNTQGSITSQVRANASAGFSVATWTGSGSGSITVGHGLGVAPQFFIVKDRSNARNWLVYHIGMGATRGMQLNLTTGQSGADAGYWNNTAPTSTVATIGTYGNEAANYVGYFWAPVVGYSSFGSYTGNGSADGPFIYTGFRPKFILVKNTSVAGAWEIYDSVRNPYNVMALTLLPNASDAEITASNGVRIDFTSNGFKWRDSGSSINGSGNTIIWAAFAESPFQYARAR